MNQPKFKFLDKVRNKNNCKSFEIAKIILEADTYAYFNRSSLMVAHESELELYTEPQKKKLFAFRSYFTGLIYFNDKDNKHVENDTKTPEFDLNYSDKE